LEIPGILSHNLGKRRIRPKTKTIPPDRYVQTSGGISIKTVEAFNKYVKTITDKESDPTTTYGVNLLRPEADDPITTGSSGKIQGAKTVRTPAIKERAKKAILYYIG
jgi:hypothetical protein